MKPLIIGIAGGTASGKSSIARKIAANIGGHVTIIKQDNYYYSHPEMTMEERDCLNFDHPESFENELLIKHLGKLRHNIAIQMPVFDYKTHLRSDETITVVPSQVFILEGILIYSDKNLRDMLDIKIFIDTDADLRILRRIERDLKDRKRTINSIFEQYRTTVRPMHLEFVEPSKRYADIIIPTGGQNTVAIDMVIRSLKQKLSITPSCE
jgi:uridine kinase